jgi:hypothetical protein
VTRTSRRPKSCDDEWPATVIPAPSTFTVEYERPPVLYLPDGRLIVKRPAGFDTSATKAPK